MLTYQKSMLSTVRQKLGMEKFFNLVIFKRVNKRKVNKKIWQVNISTISAWTMLFTYPNLRPRVVLLNMKVSLGATYLSWWFLKFYIIFWQVDFSENYVKN